jgi:hypothetical protein
MTPRSRPADSTKPSAVQDGRHCPDIAFDERGTDRLVIRRFQSHDAPTLSTYRSDPTVARYQSWDSPFTLAQAQAFIDRSTSVRVRSRSPAPAKARYALSASR